MDRFIRFISAFLSGLIIGMFLAKVLIPAVFENAVQLIGPGGQNSIISQPFTHNNDTY